MSKLQMPRGLFGPGHEGLGDPERPSIEERAHKAPARRAFEAGRRRSLSPVLRQLQRVTDAALGRSR